MTGIAAGLQAVVELPRGTERSVVQAAASQGLAVSGMAEFRDDAADSGRQLPEQDALVVHKGLRVHEPVHEMKPPDASRAGVGDG